MHAQRAAEATASSYRSEIDSLKKKHADELAALRVVTPNATRYEIVEVERVGPNLVLKVLFPNCSACAFEGNKVLVYLNVTEAQALRWRKLDPHFRPGVPAVNEAPSPAARFPATKEGWRDALAYARGKSG